MGRASLTGNLLLGGLAVMVLGTVAHEGVHMLQAVRAGRDPTIFVGPDAWRRGLLMQGVTFEKNETLLRVEAPAYAVQVGVMILLGVPLARMAFAAERGRASAGP